MEKKVVYRICTIADYDREALYLREMHAQGWKLKEVSYSNTQLISKSNLVHCLLTVDFKTLFSSP